MPGREDCLNLVRGYTADLSHVLIGTDAELTADAVGVSGDSKLYLVNTATATIELASIDETGTPFSSNGGSALPGGSQFHKQNLISPDGRFVYAQRSTTDLYRRDLETDTTEVVGLSAQFMAASRDGRYAFFPLRTICCPRIPMACSTSIAGTPRLRREMS